MTDILCEWLNEDIKVEPEISSSSFASELSNGYLFGKVLHQHGLQEDFVAFSNGRSSEAKLNNFTRLEPTFRLLNIPFSTNTAREIMTEKPGVAIRIMYHLFVALKKKKVLTGVSLECSKTPAKAKLDKVETGLYKEALKQQTPRQVDLNFEALAKKFQERHERHLEVVAEERRREEERLAKERKESCQRTLEKAHQVREKQAQLYTKLKPLTPAKTSDQGPKQKTPTSEGAANKRKTTKSLALAHETEISIDEFEVKTRHRTTTAPSDNRMRPSSDLDMPDEGRGTPRKSLTAPLHGEYISEIRRKVQDGDIARKEREIRRRRVLVQQMKALQEQEGSKREMVLVQRLMRQSLQERRVATHLMQIRTEKDSIRNNRIFRQRQYEEQREREFMDALNKEAERAKQEAEAKAIRLRHHREVRGKLLAEKAHTDHKKHYHICREVLLGIVDLSTKISEYRELTEKMVPAKLVRDWKTLFLAGKPLHESTPTPYGDEVESHSEVSHDSHVDSDQLLDESDLKEYLEAKFEWQPTKPLDVPLPRPMNPFLNHIVHRLSQLADPPAPPPNQPNLPHFVLRASFVGKSLSGKSSVLDHLRQVLRIHVINIEQLVTSAVEMYHKERVPHNLGLDMPNQDPHNQDAQPHMDGREETAQVNSGKTTPLDSPSEVETGKAGRGEGEGGGEGDGGGDGGQKDDGKRDGAVVGELSGSVRLSTVGALGEKAYNALTCGTVVDDHLMISILMEEIRSLPNGCGWVLESFPTTVEQAKLLASALTGQDNPQPQKTHHFAFVTNPQNTDKDLYSASGLDVVFFFDVSTDVVLQRAAEMEGSHQLAKLDHIQQSLCTFEENWPRVKAWYRKFKNLVTVDANVPLDAVYDQVLGHAQDIVNKAKQAAAMKRIGNPDLTFSRNDLTSTSMLDFSFIGSPRDNKRRRRQSSAERSPSKPNGVPTPTPAQASDPLFIPANLSSEPGGPDWQYTCLPLSMELAKGLATKWVSVEVCCLTKLKKVFQCLREEREAMCHYFYLRRNEFSNYLNRPDHKQEFVFQWQQSYNSIAEHLRKEDAMKIELHHRVDDLCDKLWNICDHRRDEAIQERQRIVEDQWLEDHTSLLTNYYISIMQVELDKFEDAIVLMKDYYCSMEGHVPTKLPDPPRLPLVEHPVPMKPAPPASAENSSHNMATTDDTPPDPAQVATPPVQRRVPLLPRQPPAEPVVEEKSAKKPSKGAAPPSPQPPVEDMAGLRLDEQLVVHTYNLAIAFVFSRMTAELKAIDMASQEAAKVSKPTPEPEKPEKSAESKEDKGKGKKDTKEKAPKKGGKVTPGGKSTPGKVAPDPTPMDTPAPTITPEEAARYQRMEHTRKEFRAALLHEELTVKAHLNLIKTKILEIIGEFKVKTAATYAAMEQWLEDCYKKEVESVSCLAKVLRQAIEREERLMYELVLPGTEFKIMESVVLFSPPPPPPPPPVVEASACDQFTVGQLRGLFQQFSSVAPSGVMLAESFVQYLFSMASRQLGSTLLPEQWCGLSKEQVVLVTESLFGREAEEVDWRRLLVGVAQPWPLPSKEQLLAAMETFSKIEPTCKLSYAQYMGVETWLYEEAKRCAGGYNRTEKLREAFFEIFTDANTGLIDCKKLLLYLCADPDPQEGLSKALSIAVGAPVNTKEGQTLDQPVLFEEFYAVLAHCLSLPKEYVFKLFVKANPGNPNEANLRILLGNRVIMEHVDASRALHLQDLRLIVSPPSPPEPTEEKGDTQDS